MKSLKKALPAAVSQQYAVIRFAFIESLSLRTVFKVRPGRFIGSIIFSCLFLLLLSSLKRSIFRASKSRSWILQESALPVAV